VVLAVCTQTLTTSPDTSSSNWQLSPVAHDPLHVAAQ